MTTRTWLDDIRDYTARECLTDDDWNTLLSLAYDGQMLHDLNEKGHVVEFTDSGYGLEHPATCRIEGRLLDCPVEVHIRSLTGNPFGDPGRYRVVIGETGVLEGWKLPDIEARDQVIAREAMIALGHGAADRATDEGRASE